MAARKSTPTSQLTSAVAKSLNVLRPPQANEKPLNDNRKLGLLSKVHQIENLTNIPLQASRIPLQNLSENQDSICED